MLTFDQPRMTREERRSLGRKRRQAVSRVAQGEWNPNKREFHAVELLKSAQRGRLPRLVPIKFGRMATSPFGFFRGAVPLMAADLATLPTTGLRAQICGDAHVQNLGAFEAPDGRLIFDINDFDETIRAHWEWDVKRMAASLVLAGRESGNSEKQCKAAVLTFVNSYRDSMRQFSEMAVVELARFQVYRALTPVLEVLREAERCTPLRNLAKLTVLRDGNHVLRELRPVQFHISQVERAEVLEGLRHYPRTLLPERAWFFSQYYPQDVGFRVVGTGSVGLRDYVVLMFGSAISDPLFIQIKEEAPSAFAPYVSASRHQHQGRRAADGQRLLQMQSDIFLGWTSIAGRDYLVRQLRDHKAGIKGAALQGEGLSQYAIVCGELLSKGHARSGDPCAISGYLGNSDKFDKAMTAFGVKYADQSTKDFEEFKKAIRAGTIQAAEISPAKPAKLKRHAVAAKRKKAKPARRVASQFERPEVS